jgi:hypothetical protein
MRFAGRGTGRLLLRDPDRRAQEGAPASNIERGGEPFTLDIGDVMAEPNECGAPFRFAGAVPGFQTFSDLFVYGADSRIYSVACTSSACSVCPRPAIWRHRRTTSSSDAGACTLKFAGKHRSCPARGYR